MPQGIAPADFIGFLKAIERALGFPVKPGVRKVISLLYVVLAVLNGAIEIVTLLMFARAILSWFPVLDRSSKIMSFIYMVTEFFISPVRRFMDRHGLRMNIPFDLSFLVTYLLLHVIQLIVSGILASVL